MAITKSYYCVVCSHPGYRSARIRRIDTTKYSDAVRMSAIAFAFAFAFCGCGGPCEGTYVRSSGRFFVASEKQIVANRTTDIYFVNTEKILDAYDTNPRVVAEVTAGSLPGDAPWAVFCGLEELVRYFEGTPVEMRALEEGTLFSPLTRRGIRVPVVVIEGNYRDFAAMETPLLGLICQATGIATKAAQVRRAAGDALVISFGIRRMHPALCPMIDRAAYIGGCDAVSSVLGAETIGMAPKGTMPHALTISMGKAKRAFSAYDEVLANDTPRIMLVDTYSDEVAETLVACEAVDSLDAVRLDTPGSRRGDFAALIREVRWELDIRGHEDVGVFVSGGIDETAIPALLAAGADGFGVGTSIANARTIDFSLDIVAVGDRPAAKRGKFGGRKQLYRCPQCLEYTVRYAIRSSRDADGAPPRCERCECEMREAHETVLTAGTVTTHFPTAHELRARVVDQLKRWGRTHDA